MVHLLNNYSPNRENNLPNKGWEYHLYMAFPIINVLVYSTVNIFVQDFNMSFHVGHIRGIIAVLFIVYCIIKYPVNNKLVLLTMGFSVYAIVSSFFSAYPERAIDGAIKIFIATSFFFLSFVFIKDIDDLKQLNQRMVLSLFLYMFIFILSNITGYGMTSYGPEDDTLLFGGGGVNTAKIIIMIVIAVPLIIRMQEKPQQIRITVYLLIASLVFILLAVKRSSLLALIVVALIYLFFGPEKKQIFKFLLIVVIGSLILAPFISQKVVSRFQAREEAFEAMNIRAYGLEVRDNRMLEFVIVPNELKKSHWTNKAFGFGLFGEQRYFRINRMFHTDYMSVLFGLGYLGLIWFLAINYVLTKSILKLFKNSGSILFKEIRVVVICFVIAILILGYAGTIQGIDERAIYFFYMGALYKYGLIYKTQQIQALERN